MNWRSKLHIVALSCSVLAGSACWVLSAEGDVEPPAGGSQTAYIPAPQPVRTPILIGAHSLPAVGSRQAANVGQRSETS